MSDQAGKRTCSNCTHNRDIVLFRKPAGSGFFSTCASCRARPSQPRRRPLAELDPNVPDSARPAKRPRTAVSPRLRLRSPDPHGPPPAAPPNSQFPEQQPAVRTHQLPTWSAFDLGSSPASSPEPRQPPRRQRLFLRPPRTPPPRRRRGRPAGACVLKGLCSAYKDVQEHNLGSMTAECRWCKALHWSDERVTAKNGGPVFSSCCTKGDGLLQPLHPPPPLLRSLFQDDTAEARHFRQNVRFYNNALTFTSCMYTPDERLTGQRGIRSFQMRGELFHLQGPLHNAQGQLPSFAQLYFYDPAYASASRFAQHPQLREDLLRRLADMLRDCGNPFIEYYKVARECLESHQPLLDSMRVIISPQMRLIMESGSDRRRHNLPTSNEVAVFLPDEYDQPGFRDIVITERRPDGTEPRFHRIEHSNAAYMPLHYVLVFPTGQTGWAWSLRLRNDDGDRVQDRYTHRSWFRYHLHTRTDEFSTLLHAGRLLQQYVCDAYAIIDQDKLNYLRHHQDTIRSDLYNGVADALTHDDVNTAAVGRRIILPSSYNGGDRHMQQLFQNSMAIVRHFGKPTLFITFTANPAWTEVQRALQPWQKPEDRPDIIARVFHLKQKALIKDLHTVFGRYLGSVWTIEYQKRGLPHMHCLLFLHRDDNFLERSRIDEVIRAQLPEPELDRDGVLTGIVQAQLTHGPCGEHNPNAPCMVESTNGSGRVCSKRFPKPYQNETLVEADGYPLYQRCEDGRTWIKKVNGREVTMNNRWVVPYNPYLTRRYKAHINVEVCASVQAIKYIHKYIYKGDDRTTAQLRNSEDEVARHLNGRYIGPTQAIWHLFKFTSHCEDPPVTRLAIHLPDEQPVYFGADAGSQELQDAMDGSDTTLMAFFKYNQVHTDGRAYLYQEFPAHYVYHRKKGERRWTPRKRGFAIGRMTHCSPNVGEKFYLRLLLTIVRGPQGFEQLRTFENELYPTFRAACTARGLLDDDGEWISCFTEAVLFSSGSTLRTLLVSALTQGDVVQPVLLWERFHTHLCDDLQRQMQSFPNVPEDFVDPHLDYGLFLIGQGLTDCGRTLSDFMLPLPVLNWSRSQHNALITAELSYDVDCETRVRDEKVQQLNPDQRRCFDTILTAIAQDPETAHFFVQGPAGTGKTFLYQCLCHHFRSQGDIVLCVASSGIAALLLPGGQTSHSRFRIPLVCTPTTTCFITRTSPLASLLCRTALIIWDEVPMQHKHNFTAVNFSLCDARQNEALFGGIPTLMGGDFAQTLPIVPKGNRAAQVNASIQQSILWPQIRILSLFKNMRVLPGLANEAFATWIADMSYLPQCRGRIPLPPQVTHRFYAVRDFCDHVFPPSALKQSHQTPDFFRSRAILTLRNDTVSELNGQILQGMLGETQVFNSVDCADVNDDDETHQLPAEFLQSLSPSGLPPAELHLKIGAPIILLRNLHPKQGLCNGTRLVITHLHRSCIEGRILDGAFHGQLRILFRMKLTTKEGDYPWILTRKQFPIRLCFAITVNKAQGQSLNTVGVDLRTSCFSHGQLYVALSRVTDVSRLSVLFSSSDHAVTDNVVYPEVLLPRCTAVSEV